MREALSAEPAPSAPNTIGKMAASEAEALPRASSHRAARLLL